MDMFLSVEKEGEEYIANSNLSHAPAQGVARRKITHHDTLRL